MAWERGERDRRSVYHREREGLRRGGGGGEREDEGGGERERHF